MILINVFDQTKRNELTVITQSALITTQQKYRNIIISSVMIVMPIVFQLLKIATDNVKRNAWCAVIITDANNGSVKSLT